ncbi:hypothetical protein HF1_06100 [Mycoplasma haemofelis str. Langford 1]|uniref:Uncharacterized protein n=1 Tax=Mycoplasma haemofelis (strain Langford 1) TaxID=941640 RepID=E8ZHJ7_MYCHL|nr:hypothetical protein [Mycoplasma haemofelis]CBY92618.1 hypothetical protein HF1_06100 [Mycoplasma haemofelis str. Langford 1]
MKLAGVKFLAGGATAASATGVGALGVYSVDWKEKPKDLIKTKSEDAPETTEEEEVTPINTTVESSEETREQSSEPSPVTQQETQPSVPPQPVQAASTQTKEDTTCKVFRIDNKDRSNRSFTQINWKEEKTKDRNAGSTNRTFWDDVDKACKGDRNKPSHNGNVYVTKTGERWSYSSRDQKDWGLNKK